MSVPFPKLQMFLKIFCTNLQRKYEATTMVYLHSTPTWQPENSVNILDFLCLSRQLNLPPLMPDEDNKF